MVRQRAGGAVRGPADGDDDGLVGAADVSAAPTAITVIAPPAPFAPPAARPPTPERTLGDLLAEVILRGRSPETRRAYRADLADFLSWRLGVAIALPADPEALRTGGADPGLAATLASLCRVTEGDLAAYLRGLGDGAGGRALAPATIARRLTPLRLLFRRLQRYHLIAVDPTEELRGPRLSKLSGTLWLSRAEARRLEDACAGATLRDLRDRALVITMLATGLRSAEILGLAVADLGQLEGHHVAWVTGKGGARERVKLAPKARRALDAWLDAAGLAEGPVFRRLYRLRATPDTPIAYRPHGALAYTGLKFVLRARFAAAGLAARLSPHSLRHSFVTLALKGGAPLPKVQHAARHADPQTTMRYAHEQDDLDDNAADYVRW